VITGIGIVLGDLYPEKVREYYGDGSRFGINITYIYQGVPLGIAHAIKVCKEFVKNDKFIVYLGDNILRGGIRNFVKKFEEGDQDSMILLSKEFKIYTLKDILVILTIHIPQTYKRFLKKLYFLIYDDSKCFFLK